MSDDQFVTDYNDVAARIVEFRTKHPEGSLQPADRAKPFEVLTIGDLTYIVYGAAAYRHPDDKLPGIAYAYELVPGRTKFTRNSELQNAETSAWGRAIQAALAADARKGLASAEEVRNRRAEQEIKTNPDWLNKARETIANATSIQALAGAEGEIARAVRAGEVADTDRDHLRDLCRRARQGLAAANTPDPEPAPEQEVAA